MPARSTTDPDGPRCMVSCGTMNLPRCRFPRQNRLVSQCRGNTSKSFSASRCAQATQGSRLRTPFCSLARAAAPWSSDSAARHQQVAFVRRGHQGERQHNTNVTRYVRDHVVARCRARSRPLREPRLLRRALAAQESATSRRFRQRRCWKGEQRYWRREPHVHHVATESLRDSRWRDGPNGRSPVMRRS
jgi:hypothetical protein